MCNITVIIAEVLWIILYTFSTFSTNFVFFYLGSSLLYCVRWYMLLFPFLFSSSGRFSISFCFELPICIVFSLSFLNLLPFQLEASLAVFAVHALHAVLYYSTNYRFVWRHYLRSPILAFSYVDPFFRLYFASYPFFLTFYLLILIASQLFMFPLFYLYALVKVHVWQVYLRIENHWSTITLVLRFIYLIYLFSQGVGDMFMLKVIIHTYL